MYQRQPTKLTQRYRVLSIRSEMTAVVSIHNYKEKSILENLNLRSIFGCTRIPWFKLSFDNVPDQLIQTVNQVLVSISHKNNHFT